MEGGVVLVLLLLVVLQILQVPDNLIQFGVLVLEAAAAAVGDVPVVRGVSIFFLRASLRRPVVADA